MGGFLSHSLVSIISYTKLQMYLHGTLGLRRKPNNTNLRKSELHDCARSLQELKCVCCDCGGETSDRSHPVRMFLLFRWSAPCVSSVLRKFNYRESTRFVPYLFMFLGWLDYLDWLWSTGMVINDTYGHTSWCFSIKPDKDRKFYGTLMLIFG